MHTSRSHGEDHRNHSPPRNPDPSYRWSARPSIPLAQPKPDGTSGHLPPYIRPLPRHLKPRDVQYLADKGALTIPDEPFRNELLRTYTYMVYPIMPAIDYEMFLQAIVMADGRDPVSLLLFQAVMFAGVTFVDGKLLRERGYAGRKAARKELFGRVQLLYGLDCEPDRLSLLQAVLLMTYWYDSQADDKDTWYWMGVALGRAQVLGLHREPDPSRTPPRARQLKRRIWWSCVVRDRLLALGIRRPSRIRNEDFDVSPLTIDDFDLRAPTDPVAKILGHSKIIASGPAFRLELGVVCMDLTKLCLCLGRILHSQYSLTGNHAAGSEYLTRAIVIPTQSSTQRQDMAECDAELEEWLNNQDSRSVYAAPGPEPEDTTDEALRIIRIHKALLQMVYLTAVSILHRPLAFQPGCDGADGARKKASREKVTQAAVATTKLAFQLQANNKLRYLSTSSIPAFLSASLVHLMDIRSADEEVRNISIGRFYQCVQALQELQDMYGSADCAVQFLEGVLRKTDINVPMMRHCLFHPSGVGIGHQAGRLPGSTPDRALDRTGVETPYPSPPSSWNRQTNLEAPGVRDDDTFEAGMAFSGSPLNDQFVDTWAADNGQFGNNQDPGEAVVDSALMGGWVDVDSLVPAPVNFDPDSNLSLANPVGFM